MRPVLLSIGKFLVRGYGVMTVAGYLAAALYMRRYRERLGLSREQWRDLMLIVIVAALVGGKLGGLAFYYRGGWHGWRTLFAGGLSFYQGFWLAAACAWLYCRGIGKAFAPIADRFAVALPLGHALGRFGCFLNGCCYGVACAWPWAVTFTDRRAHMPDARLGVPLHPTQLYDAFGNLAIAAALHAWLASPRATRRPPGLAIGVYLISYGALRLLIEPFRADNPGLSAWGLSTASWVSLATIAAGACLALRAWRARPAG